MNATDSSLVKSQENKKKQFERIFASRYDFSQASFCAHTLLKKRWHVYPWERRGSIYAQQTAFVTSLIVSYARPFTKSRGWSLFPVKLAGFSEEQKVVHSSLLKRRNEIFAHSDSQHFMFEPWHSDEFRTTIEMVPSALICVQEARVIVSMTDKLISAASERLNILHCELVGPGHTSS